jgi:formylglycine-generating enzyme required for sulfatase activity
MAFASLADGKIRFCIWETRVQDFEAFVKATDYDTSIWGGLDKETQKKGWKNPGFEQSGLHPVVRVSWEDAHAFCEWLTMKEQKEGRITLQQKYRLPTNAEWSQMAGPGIYPWLHANSPANPSTPPASEAKEKRADERRFFPPPAGAGNYAGMEARVALNKPMDRVLRNYEDKYPRTAPVGSFAPNALGIYDLGGNVWEWCEDWFKRDMISSDLESKVPYFINDGGGNKYRVLRGASWLDSSPVILRSDCPFFEFPFHQSDTIGFRIVCAASGATSSLPEPQSDSQGGAAIK